MTIQWSQLADENTRFLSRLLQFDTTNPPGNETECLRWIQSELAKDEISSQLLESAPGRGNLIARIRAKGTPRGGALLLMGHVDVVPADASEWRHPPFSGAIADGCVWGRGALDMKGTVSTWVVLVRALNRMADKLTRDVVLMLNADEETGGAMGAGWVAEHHWDLIDCEVALNEGGGTPIEVDGSLFYTYSVEEKVPGRFKMTARGTPGHGSVPKPENAVVTLAKAVHTIGSARLPARIVPTFEATIKTLASHFEGTKREQLLRALDPSTVDAALDAAIDNKDFREKLRAMVRDTLSPTMLEAGAKINSVPSTASAWVDCRLMPGSSVATVKAQVQELLAQQGLADSVQLEFTERPAFPASPVEHPLIDEIRGSLARNAPGAGLLPLLTTGATDSRSVRPRGVAAYGFYPALPTVDRTGVHAIDERVPLDQIAWATRTVGEAIVAFCTKEP